MSEVVFEDDPDGGFTYPDDPACTRACAVCGSTDDLSFCTGCEDIYYCGPECQLKDWPNHKTYCKAKRRGGRALTATAAAAVADAAAAAGGGVKRGKSPAVPSAPGSRASLTQSAQLPKPSVSPSHSESDMSEDYEEEGDESGLGGMSVRRRSPKGSAEHGWSKWRKLVSDASSEARQKLEAMNLGEKAAKQMSHVKKAAGSAGGTLRRALKRSDMEEAALASSSSAAAGAGAPPAIMSSADLTPAPPADSTTAVFGVPLQAALKRSAHISPDLPDVVVKCCRYITERGLDEEGIFRQSGGLRHLATVRNAFQRGEDPDLSEIGDPHIVSGLLKMWFRELPVPILAEARPDNAPRLPEPDTRKLTTDEMRNAYEKLIQLPDTNIMVVGHLMELLCKVEAQNAVNKMSLGNLCIVFSATLQCSHELFTTMLRFREIVFERLPAARFPSAAAPTAPAAAAPTIPSVRSPTVPAAAAPTAPAVPATAAPAAPVVSAPNVVVVPPQSAAVAVPAGAGRPSHSPPGSVTSSTPGRHKPPTAAVGAPVKPLPALPGRQAGAPNAIQAPAPLQVPPRQQQQQHQSKSPPAVARPPPVDLLS